MIKVYDTNMNLQAILKNAYAEGYNKKYNEVWNAEFSLPANDPKIVECQPFRFVELFEADGERVELFRILPYKYSKNLDGKTITFTCEHVLSTLLDDILFQYHQNSNLSPADNITYVLSQQSTARWQVGQVDFSDVFEYSWENKNLLGALFDIPKPYTGEYQWTFDTTTYPWKLNLIKPSTEPTVRIIYRRNMVDIEKVEDPTDIITRLYPLGYGEGVNQLTISSVNNNVPYIDADTKSTYGVIAAPYIDKEEENASTLKAKAQAYLETVKNPKVTYSADAADLFSITGEPMDKIREPGIMVQVLDEDLGVFNARLKNVSKSDITGAPGDIKVEIGNKVLTSADTTTEIQSKQYITDTTAQGATNIDSNDYEDNCDSDHPAVIKFYIPNECVRINKCLLSYEISKFRAYETGAASKDLGTLTISKNTTEESLHEHLWGEASTGGVVGTADSHYHNISIQNTWGLHAHAHDMSHTHTIGSHSHDIVYGIYEKSEMPTALTIKVDGTEISHTELSGNNIDLVDYLSTETNSKIKRGQFHTVEITPNNLARITATVIKQLFLQSRGGGDY